MQIFIKNNIGVSIKKSGPADKKDRMLFNKWQDICDICIALLHRNRLLQPQKGFR